MKKKVKDECKQPVKPQVQAQAKKHELQKPVVIQQMNPQQPPAFKIGGNPQPQQIPKVVPSFSQQPAFFGQTTSLQQPTKPITTINNANVAVSATFSIPLSSKVSPSSDKINQPQLSVPKPPEPEQTTNKTENVTFTFKLPDKKEQAAVKPSPAFSIPLETTKSEVKTEPPKSAFSFGGLDTGTLSFGGLSFANTQKSSPFASLSTLTSNSNVPSTVSMSQVDSTVKSPPSEGIIVPKPTVATEQNKPTGLFNISANTAISSDPLPVSTSAPGLFSSIKQLETMSGFGLDPRKSPTSTTSSSAVSSSFTFANLVPASVPQGK